LAQGCSIKRLGLLVTLGLLARSQVACLPDMDSELADVFMAFTGGAAEMDGRTFLKCMRGTGLMDRGLMTPDVDLIFVKCKPKGFRKIDFKEFLTCLVEVSAKTGLSESDVMELVLAAASSGPSSRTGSAVLPSLVGVGPERFFYDKTTYTGTHKNGGPTAIGGGGDGDLISHEALVNRDLEEAQQRRKTNIPLPTLLGGLGTDDAHDSKVMLAAAPARRHSQVEQRSKSPQRAPSPPRAQSPVGPERFYYDRSTYTGTHRHGGPTMLGSGLPKAGGYDDLSQLVNRDHVQDDALHRRTSVSPPPAASPPLEKACQPQHRSLTPPRRLAQRSLTPPQPITTSMQPKASSKTRQIAAPSQPIQSQLPPAVPEAEMPPAAGVSASVDKIVSGSLAQGTAAAPSAVAARNLRASLSLSQLQLAQPQPPLQPQSSQPQLLSPATTVAPANYRFTAVAAAEAAAAAARAAAVVSAANPQQCRWIPAQARPVSAALNRGNTF